MIWLEPPRCPMCGTTMQDHTMSNKKAWWKCPNCLHEIIKIK